MAVHRLIVDHGRLHFPYGGVSFCDETLGDDMPSMLMRIYAAGDCDTCPWPMQSDFATEAELRGRLACALYGERETNARFKYGDTIELPDGTPFDFDSLVP